MTTLTSEQLTRIDGFVNPADGSSPNYAAMYEYIFLQVGDQLPADQAYWFQQAAEINQYVNDVSNGFDLNPKQSAYFIQQMNKASGNSSDDDIANVSNEIGLRVYNDIIDGNGMIPDFSSQIVNDIKGAIVDSSLDLSQWGGILLLGYCTAS